MGARVGYVKVFCMVRMPRCRWKGRDQGCAAKMKIRSLAFCPWHANILQAEVVGFFGTVSKNVSDPWSMRRHLKAEGEKKSSLNGCGN